MEGIFEVNPVKLLALSNDFTNVTQQCNSLTDDLENVKNSLSSASFGEIKSALNVILGSMRNEISDITTLKTTLENTARTYQAAELAILQGNVSDVEPTAASGTDMNFNDSDADLSILWDLLRSTGSIPSAMTPYLKMLLSRITGEEINATVLADILNSSINQFAFFTDVAESGWSEALKNAFGIAAYMPEGTAPGLSFSEYLKTALGKELDEFTDLSTLGKGAGAVAKWAGVGLTLATDGYDNYEEFQNGDISAERAVAETIIETGVDVFLGVGATAAVGAGLAFVGVVGAPAILVAAGGAAVVAGANAAFEHFTGKDIAEHFSDFICDSGSSIASWFKK